MAFFNQFGKKKKKEQTDNMEDFQTAETEQSSLEKTEPEKSRFLTPKERHVSKVKDGNQTSEDDGMAISHSNKIINHGNPIIINGEDYLLRISETRMEALITLYRRFSVEEIRTLLEESGVVVGIREKTLEELAQGKQNYEETLVATGIAAKDGRDGYFEYHFNPQPETRPIILSDGTVDYNVLGKIELVKKEQLLATYHSALPYVVGRDVMGNIIEAYEGK